MWNATTFREQSRFTEERVRTQRKAIGGERHPIHYTITSWEFRRSYFSRVECKEAFSKGSSCTPTTCRRQSGQALLAQLAFRVTDMTRQSIADDYLAAGMIYNRALVVPISQVVTRTRAYQCISVPLDTISLSVS